MHNESPFKGKWIQQIIGFQAFPIQNEVIQQFDQYVHTEVESHAVKCSFYGHADDCDNS